MQQCYLVAVFWRDNNSVLSTVRVCNDGEPMTELACRGLAQTVEARMKTDNADIYYPELEHTITRVELYLVEASLINTMNTAELWCQHFTSAFASGNLVFVTNIAPGNVA
jgi:hypothetical protein